MTHISHSRVKVTNPERGAEAKAWFKEQYKRRLAKKPLKPLHCWYVPCGKLIVTKDKRKKFCNKTCRNKYQNWKKKMLKQGEAEAEKEQFSQEELKELYRIGTTDTANNPERARVRRLRKLGVKVEY
jgi:hypothetical protein